MIDLILIATETTYASSEEAPVWLLALGPAGGIAVYWALYRYYRNTDKSHQFERETTIVAEPVSGSDDQIDTIRGTRQSSTDNANSSDHRERVRRSS